MEKEFLLQKVKQRGTVVTTDDEFKRAVNSSVDIIRIRGNIGGNGKNIYELPDGDGKKIIIESGYTFKITSGLSRKYTTDIEICDNAKLIIDSTRQFETIWLKGIIKMKVISMPLDLEMYM